MVIFENSSAPANLKLPKPVRMDEGYSAKETGEPIGKPPNVGTTAVMPERVPIAASGDLVKVLTKIAEELRLIRIELAVANGLRGGEGYPDR